MPHIGTKTYLTKIANGPVDKEMVRIGRQGVGKKCKRNSVKKVQRD
jgi:hypothetical protein